jgi:NDP-sugar pyrophosphorylase family protein
MITQAHILAGGRAERLHCHDLPKPLYRIPDDGKPAIDYVLDLVVRAGLRDLIVTIPNQEIHPDWGRQISEHVAEAYGKYFSDIKFLKSGRTRIDSVIEASKFYGERFLLLGADIFSNADLNRLVRVHEQGNVLFSLIAVPSRDALECGIVVQQGDTMKFIPKRQHRTSAGLIDTAFYAATKEFVSQLESSSNFDAAIVSAFESRKSNVDVQDAFWYDINTPEKYRTACMVARSMTNEA